MDDWKKLFDPKVHIVKAMVFPVKVKMKSLSRVRLLATPWTAAHQAPPSVGFSRQEYWSGVPLPSPNHSILYVLSMRELYIELVV